MCFPHRKISDVLRYISIVRESVAPFLLPFIGETLNVFNIVDELQIKN